MPLQPPALGHTTWRPVAWWLVFRMWLWVLSNFVGEELL
jgi:hypothetical protein